LSRMVSSSILTEQTFRTYVSCLPRREHSMTSY
jgi:hypothetical protein